MEDTITQSFIQNNQMLNKKYSIQESEKSKFLKELLHPDCLRSSVLQQNQLQISQSARKMLETVLRNSDITTAVPHSQNDYTNLTLNIMQNQEQSNTNVAYIIRSMVDLLQYDTQLELLVINDFGFQRESRIFQNSNECDSTSDFQPHNSNNSNKRGDHQIGTILLIQFLIQFGARFELQDERHPHYYKIVDYAKINKIQIQNINNDDDSQYLKLGNSQSDHTQMISPICSQQQFNEAKQYEASQITKIFEDSQLQYLKTKGELYNINKHEQWQEQNHLLETYNNEELGEDLVAHEDLSCLNPKLKMNITKPLINRTSYGNQQRRFPEYTGLQALLNQTQQILKDQQLIKPNQIKQLANSIDNKQQKQTEPIIQIHKIQESGNKLLQDINHHLNLKLPSEKSLISANNSFFNTPIKPPANILYPNNSSIKPRSSNKNLFGQNSNNSSLPNFYQQSPKFLSTTLNRDLTKAPRILSFSANKLFPEQQLQTPVKSQFQNIGTKRQTDFSTQQLESNILQNTNQNDGFSTPLNKRQRLEPQSTVTKGSHYPNRDDSIENQNSSDSDEDKDYQVLAKDDQNQLGGEVNDAASSASRKKRGLKILSVKVQELVFKKEHTTYKDVANELIKQLRDKKKNQGDAADLDDFDSGADDEDMSCEDGSPTKKTDKGGDQASSQQKWEKNVRRRVYDALNVLYAAGVLKKEGKHVSCDKQVLQLTNKMKDSHQQSAQSSSQKSSRSKSQQPSIQDQKMMQHIENLKLQLALQMQRVESKRDNLHEQFKHFISYKHLIVRNKDLKTKGYYDPNKSISLPFILVATKDCPENEVEISFSDQHKSLNIAMKKPMKCIGDADTLIKLGLYKVSEDFIYNHINEGEGILKCLNNHQRDEILA